MYIKLFVALAAWCATAAGSLPPGSLLMPLKRIVNQTAYGVEMRVGTPPQTMYVLADTGSSTLGFQGAASNWCMESDKPCRKYGSYNNLTSTTARYKNNKYFDELANFGSGDFIIDTVRVGGRTFLNTTFGMILYYSGFPTAPNPNTGIFGIAPFCSNKACTKPKAGEETFQQRLISRGLIKNNIVSIYMGPEEPLAQGELLFSAIDRAKQKGKVLTLPVLNPISSAASSSAINLNYSSITLSTAGGKTSAFTIPKGAFAFLDTGNPRWNLPSPVLKYLKSYFNITKNTPENTYSGAFDVDCKFRAQQADNATLLVGFGKNSELEILIPLSRLVTQLSSTHCVSAIGECVPGSPMCSFGDPFLRSTYLSFDFDALTATISNVEYTDKTDIVAA